ncbi:hypothetical protein B5E53_12735 [Eubacterium sp. An11]|uniref:DUF885 domain-containing protein n=1 Tax=Eubacterium sp. An11 TaxID=1965542 RepID=UPI000B37D637|nr:DUF885 domain-containing protein [Eubacterium sp. An11]OUQ65205.1 hypothetical protein B5E53_12735 [Eubacterium sp. An11]
MLLTRILRFFSPKRRLFLPVTHTVRRHFSAVRQLILPLFFILALTGCSEPDRVSQKQFDTFLDNCFKEYVSSDTVTLHFKLSDPSAYGIDENISPSYGDFSVAKQTELCQRSSELLKELNTFDPDTLSEEDAFIWRILKNYLETSVDSKDYILYQSFLGTNGLQSQIPVTLSEYYFDDEKDIQDYLALINQVPELFDQLLDFEQQRREAGFISPDFVVSDTIDQIDQFLTASGDDNLLIETFEDKIENVSDLGKDQKQTYINNNRSLVRQVVLPAFKSLRDSLEEYLDDSSDKERLCQYDGGKEYYELLLSSNVGTDMTPKECIQALEDTLQETASDIVTLTQENSDLYTDYLTAEPLLTDTQEILTELENDTLIDFPEPPDVSYTLKNVPDALSSTSASAFYLLPPIDSKEANVIYINQSRVDSRDQFSTLAHEGYPGHLYQTNYYLSTDPHPVRSVLRCDGYDEGWGTYAQLYSYNYMEFKDTDRETTALLRQLYRDNDILSLALSSLSDLYVNYEDYTEEELTAYLSDYGVESEGARSIYEYVIENPTTYLSYSIGWYELEQLRNTMEEELGSHFDISEYHEAVLSCGSCPFSLLEEQVSSLMTE